MPGIFLCSPTFNLFSKLMWNFTVANKIKFFCGNWSMYKLFTKKLYQRELVTSDWFFVIRNSSGVQIFRNDEKARQRHLPKMYTLVVTMNWNRFRKIFRIRFCIFYNRSELSHCTIYWMNSHDHDDNGHSVTRLCKACIDFPRQILLFSEWMEWRKHLMNWQEEKILL